MGIGKFGEFVRQHAPNCYFEIPLESFRGKRVAVDMYNLVYKMMSVSMKEVAGGENVIHEPPNMSVINHRTFDRVMSNLMIYMNHGITPVCVFDGKNHPLKSHILTERQREGAKKRSRLENAKSKLYSVDPIQRTGEMVKEYQRSFTGYVKVQHGFMMLICDTLYNIGFPVLMADALDIPTKDAEGICATLCLGGNDYCAAGVTIDSDFHVYGGNNQIIDVYAKRVKMGAASINVYHAKVRSLEAILAQTQMSFDQFRDLCIMLGTDFNPNIRQVGVVKSWNYIKNYGSIMELSRYLDVSVLNYENVVRLFDSTLVKLEIPPPDFDQERFRENCRRVLANLWNQISDGEREEPSDLVKYEAELMDAIPSYVHVEK